MDWSLLVQWEWLLIELVVLGIAVFELVSVTRSQRRDREARAQRDAGAAPER